ncbi:MAG: hypothetical protein HC827_03765 [Cyanobacteria bacterium RM1_2_2]|nr:hypothetical protein [Cyanobacteria bacterium RM1_2_2]
MHLILKIGRHDRFWQGKKLFSRVKSGSRDETSQESGWAIHNWYIKILPRTISAIAVAIMLGAVIQFSENPNDGSVTAPSLFLRASAIRRMPSTVDHSGMTRPRSNALGSLSPILSSNLERVH